MLNPKAAVFFVIFLPRFLPAGWLRRARVQAWLERVTGACLLAFGARLELARH